MKPNYYAIITASVRYDKSISSNAKLLYAEITSILNMQGKCFATNSYFAELYNVDESTIQRWLKSLEDNGYIKRVITYKEGTKQVDKRYMQLCGDPSPQLCGDPHRKNAQDNINLTGSNNNKKEEGINFQDIKHREVDDRVPLSKWGNNWIEFEKNCPEDFINICKSSYADKNQAKQSLKIFFDDNMVINSRFPEWKWNDILIKNITKQKRK